MKYSVGCASLRAAVVDMENGAVLSHFEVPTLSRYRNETVLLRMADLITGLINEDQFSGIAFGGVGIRELRG